MWQDVSVSEDQNDEQAPAAGGQPGPPFPGVMQVETLKALAAPSRLRILYALLPTGRVMSVKEMAEELGEPQTRLYRHVKVLESAGLIEVAATRIVSGIVEQRYRVAHGDLRLDPAVVRSAPQAMRAALVTMMTLYAEQFLAAYGDAPGQDEQIPDGEAYRKPRMSLAEVRVAKDKAAEIRTKLEEIMHELSADKEDPDGVPVSVLIGFFSSARTGWGLPLPDRSTSPDNDEGLEREQPG
jgi:DNA-binding transcriptional ArsR family regulator